MKRDAVFAGHSDHCCDVRRTRWDLAIQRRKHLNRMASPSRNFQHFATTGSIAECVNGTGGDMHERTCYAHRGLAIACELNLALGYVKRLFSIVAVRRRPRSFVARLQCDLLVFRIRVRNQDGDIRADDSESAAAFSRLHDEPF